MLGPILAIALAAGAFIMPGAQEKATDNGTSATLTSNGCPIGQPWTDDVLADVLHVSGEKVRKLHEIRGLTPAEICTMPRDKLARAIVKVDDPKPDMPGEAAAFREMQQRSDDGMVRPDGLVSAFSERLAITSKVGIERAGIDKTSWTALGPGNIGGRLRSVLTHPTDPNLLFVGSVAGGIWKSTNGGTSWAPVNDFMPNVAISSLVRDPSNPQRIYAGTGEGFYNGDGIRGFGAFVSTDGGTTWAQLGGTVPDTSNPPATQQSDFLLVNRIAVHPTNPDIVLIATTSAYYCNWGGVYRTTNATAAIPIWTLVYARRALDVRFDSSNGNNVIVGEGGHCAWNGAAWVSDGGGVAWSNNAGSTFTRVALDTYTKGRVEVAWAKATANLVVAVTEGNGGAGGDGRFWVSTNAGQSWQLNSQPGHLSGQGWYNNALWVDPTDSKRIVVGGLDVYRGAGAANWWVSNTAVPWTKISQWYTATSVHADNHAIVNAGAFDGSGNRQVYIGNDGGLYKSADIAAHDGIDPSANWVNLNNGLQVTQFYGGAGRSGYAGPVSTLVVGGTQDNGSLKAPVTGTSWSTWFGGDGGYAAVDPADPNYYYGEYVRAAIHRATTGGGSSIICGGTNPITEGQTGYCVASGGGQANFISPFILDPNNANTLLVGARSLWRSANVKAAAPDWFVIKAPDAYSTSNYISAIAVAPGNSNFVWVGHNHGEVYCTVNGTVTTPTWTKVTALTATRMVLRIMVDPTNTNRVFVTYGGYNGGNVVEVTDASQVCKATPTLTDRHGNLPQAPVRSIVRHPTNANWLYVGTEVGVFATTDGGVTWSASNDGPGSVSVDELFWLNSGTLIAATHGRGMFQAAVAAVPAATTTGAGDVAGTLATLNGIASANGATTAVTFEYGLTTSYGSTATAAQSPLLPSASATAVSAGVAGLTCNTTYHYRAVAGNNAGTTPGLDATFKTWICPPDKVWDAFWRKSDGTNSVWQFFGTGPSQFTPAFPPGVPTNWTPKAVGDVNGDGVPDVVWLEPATGQVAVWLMNSPSVIGSATFPGSVGAGSSWVLTAVGDVNGDGRADLVWRNSSTGGTLVWLMNASGNIGSTLDLGVVPLAYALVGVGDFNGDGTRDLLWFRAADGQVVLWLMAANGTYTPAFPGAVGPGTWQPYRAGDFDGDGKADIFWRDTTTGMTAVWYLNGGAIAASDFFVSVPLASWTLGTAGDFDLDGRSDVMWHAPASGNVVRWLMQGRNVAPVIQVLSGVGTGWQLVP
ncbi:MAG: FG-GAP-like repeat-containing protein [Burkholderiales bacterium]